MGRGYDQKVPQDRSTISPRVSTFLSGISRYQANMRHLAGSANVPSDFASRNAAVCVEQQCQVCTFIREIEEYVVMQRVTTNDITYGRAKLPFTSVYLLGSISRQSAKTSDVLMRTSSKGRDRRRKSPMPKTWNAI